MTATTSPSIDLSSIDEGARQAGIDKLVHGKLVTEMKADPSVTVEQAAIRLLAAETKARAVDTSSLDTYRSMRRGMMLVAFFLPIVLYVGWSWGEWPRSSMSFYYYSGRAQDVFVGALCAIGVFLVLYRPLNTTESRWLTVAGFAALAIALFPMNKDGDCSPTDTWSVHGVSAVIFFGAITFVCLRFPATEKPWRRLVSRWVCGLVMGSCIVSALAYNYAVPYLFGPGAKATLCNYSIIFWIELFAVWAFTLYWLLKSLDEERTLKEILAHIPAVALFWQLPGIRNLRS